MADSVQYKSLPEVLYCKTCNYYTCNKKQIEKHFISSKHIKNSSISAAPSEEPSASELTMHSDISLAPPDTPNSIICECCGKKYKNKATFIRHQRTIKQQEQQNIKDDNISLENQENIDKSLELITDDDDDDDDDDDADNSSNIEFEYITFNPLIINHDAAYFIQTFMYSIDILMGISVFINKIFSFFSLKSDDDSD
jgi:hypothetical protein